MEVDIIHYDGSTETSLGTKQSPDISNTGTNAFKVAVMEIPLTQKTFKNGDTLRLNVRLNISATAGSGLGQVGLFHDPLNADDGSTWTGERTRAEIRVPYKIDL
jgi:hypothetical protein